MNYNKCSKETEKMSSGSHSMPWPLISSKKSQPVLSAVSVHVAGEQESQELNSTRQSGGKTYINVLMSMFANNIETNKNNDKFHVMFNTIPTDELLIGQFECALHRGDALTKLETNNSTSSEVVVTKSNESNTNSTICPYIGTLYVSKDHLCFNTKNFQHGWLFTRLQISFQQIINVILCEQAVIDDVDNIENDYNGKYIIIETHLGKIQLNGFDSVEHVFNLVYTLWQNMKQNIDNNMIMMPSLYNLIKDSNRIHDDVEIMANDMRIEDLITSIDSGESVDENDNEDEEEEDEEGGEEEEEDTESELNEANDNIPVYKFKEDIPLKYQFNGPYYNKTVNYNYTPPELNSNEHLLKEEEFDKISPGLLFELLFSGHELSLQSALLNAEGSTQVSEYGPYIEGHRQYTYVKKLGYSIGPQSTKCEVEQTIVKYDNDCIEWVSTTKTPNVPSGNLFQVKNRFLFYWQSGYKSNGCKMRISYWIEWNGKSWLKSVIEKSCKQGIIESQERFDSFLQDYINKYLIVSNVGVKKVVESEEIVVKKEEEIATKKKQEEVTNVVINEQVNKPFTKQVKSREFRFIDIIMGSLLLINLIVLLIILKNVQNNNQNKIEFKYDNENNKDSGKIKNNLVEMLIDKF